MSGQKIIDGLHEALESFSERKKALRDLLVKIEAGTDAPFWHMPEAMLNQFASKEIQLIQDANLSNMNAVTAFLSAVLPGCGYSLNVEGEYVRAWVYKPTRGAPPEFEGVSTNKIPSRALLIAGLKALISEGEE